MNMKDFGSMDISKEKESLLGKMDRRTQESGL